MRKTSLVIAAILASAAIAAAAEPQTFGEKAVGEQVAGEKAVGEKVAGQTAAPADAAARYAFNRVNDGFLRLDNVSGQVSVCNQTSAGWACQAVPEDRAALEKEIARLQDQVASLQQQVVALRDPAPPRPPADLSGPSAQGERAAELRADLSRAKAAVANAWQRVVDMIKGIQKDMMRKS